MGQFQTVIDLLERADEVGAGGKQRELLQKAIKNLAEEFINLNWEAGFSREEGRESVVEMVSGLDDFPEDVTRGEEHINFG